MVLGSVRGFCLFSYCGFLLFCWVLCFLGFFWRVIIIVVTFIEEEEKKNNL